ncbi:MAG: alpha-ketoacid dehydrogenase subunit beta, partial [Gaiellaceae bacterium]
KTSTPPITNESAVPELTYIQAISDGLRLEMRRDQRVFVMGQDVGVYGGAFKVTLGFQEEFGPWRVIDAPLSETAIVGGATGAALMGLRPVAEMQFADFVSCAWDHLVTVAAKQFFRGRTPVPIVVRLPSGGGFSGGPFHSQNPESSFAHIPGLKIVCPSTPHDAKGLLASAIEDPNPVLYFEHKHLYRRIKGEVPEERYTIPFGQARVHREGDDAVVVTWGAMVHTASEAADELAREGFEIEILDLRTLIPWDKERVLSSVRRTSKALVLHEDTRTGGFGAEIAATIAEDAFEDLDAPVMRIAAPDTPVPFSPALEKAFLPQVDGVVTALKELAAY